MNKIRGEKVIIIAHFTFHRPPMRERERELEAGRAQVVGATRTGRNRSGWHIRVHTPLSLRGKCWYCRVIKLDIKLTNLDTTWVLTNVHLLSSRRGGDEGCSWSWRRDMCRHSKRTRSANHIRIPQGHSGHWMDAPSSTHTHTPQETHTHIHIGGKGSGFGYEGGPWCLKCRVLRLQTRKMIPL